MLLILDHYYSVPRPVFQTTKKSYISNKQTEEEVITPQHEEIVNYIHECKLLSQVNYLEYIVIFLYIFLFLSCCSVEHGCGR